MENSVAACVRNMDPGHARQSLQPCLQWSHVPGHSQAVESSQDWLCWWTTTSDPVELVHVGGQQCLQVWFMAD
jgi:hypothetical protein